jgi:hypothetical protein
VWILWSATSFEQRRSRLLLYSRAVLLGLASPGFGAHQAPSPGELFSQTNDNSVAILLSYGTARVLLAGDAKASEEYMASSSYSRP